MPPSITFLICTYRAPASLDLLFDSLQIQKWQEGDEIVVVDNGVGKDRLSLLRERLDQLTSTGIKTTYAKEPKVGLTNARLNGFALVKNEWLVLLDDDNILDENSLSQIRHRIALNPGLGGICPRIEAVWEEAPPDWVVMLGHEVLSYNTSPIRSVPELSLEWEAGKWGLRPPGGGMIIHRSATDAFLAMSQTFPLLTDLGHRGTSLGSGEDYILYLQAYQSGRPTAYNGSIIIRHIISPDRMRFSYLCRLLFHANYAFALIALALHGKILFLPSIGHAALRLSMRLFTAGRHAVSLRVLVAFACAFAGYVCGTFSGLFRGDLPLFNRRGLR
jgi:glycosyltransferase involved in cell wall biosynthesis